MGDGGTLEDSGEALWGLAGLGVVGEVGLDDEGELVSIFGFCTACSISFGGASKVIFLRKKHGINSAVK